MANVLGIDGGFASIGVSIIELLADSEALRLSRVIRTEKSDKKREVRQSDDNMRRAGLIARDLAAIIRTYKPEAICIEAMSFPRSSSVAAKMALTFGIVAALAEGYDLPIIQASPQDVKLAMCGRKNASKDEICAEVETRFPEIAWPAQKGLWEHAADAVAVVVACLDSNALKMARLLERDVG